MALKECESLETVHTQPKTEQSLETLADLRRTAQKMYATQFQAAVDNGAVLSPQQMRVGISLLNLIRRTVLDEARLARDSARDANRDTARGTTRGAARNSVRPTFASFKAGSHETAEVLEPSVTQDASAPDPEYADEMLITPIAGEANDGWSHEQDESPALEGSPGSDFRQIPGLVVGEVRRIFVNGDLIPDPGPEEARRMRYEWGKAR